MEYQELQTDIKRGVLHHVYLLTGEEPYYIRRAKESLLKVLFTDPGEKDSGLIVLDTEPSANDFIAAVNSAPFLSDKNVLLIERSRLFRDKHSDGSGETEAGDGEESVAAVQDKKSDKETEKLIKALTEIPSYSYVIFVAAGKADKRRKIYKTVLKIGCVVESQPIRPYEVAKKGIISAMAQKLAKPLDRDAVAYLENIIGVMPNVSLDFIEQELKKTQLYALGDTVTKADLMATLSSLPEVSAFAMSDAISERNAKKALTLLHEQLRSGIHPIMLLAILVRHIRQLWQIKDMVSKRVPFNELGGKLGINPYIARKLGQAAVKFDAVTLRNAFLASADTDYKLKTGQGGAEYLESIIIMLCQDRRQLHR